MIYICSVNMKDHLFTVHLERLEAEYFWPQWLWRVKKRFRVPQVEHALPPKIDSREEIGYLIYVVGGAMIWYDNRKLSLNVNRTKEITVVFRRKHTVFTPLNRHGNTVQPARSTSSLGARMTDDLRCSTDTTSLVKRASQRTPFLWQMKRANMPPPVLMTFTQRRQTASSQTPPVHSGAAPVSMQSSVHPSHGLGVLLLDNDSAAYRARPELEKTVKTSQLCLPLNSELLCYHTQTNKMSTRSDSESGGMKLCLCDFLYCLMTISFDLKYLPWLLQMNDLLNKFMFSTIISTLYVLRETITTVILKNILLYNNLYRMIPLIPWALLFYKFECFWGSFVSTYQNELLFCIN